MTATTFTQTGEVPMARYVLQDYDLHHSDPTADEQAASEEEDNNTASQAAVDTPAGWDRPWRRVPAYRPADPSRLTEDRTTSANGIERGFIWVMFGGECFGWTGTAGRDD